MSDLYAQFVNENERWIKQGSGATKEQLNGAAMYDAWLDHHAAPPPTESTQVDESGSSEPSVTIRDLEIIVATVLDDTEEGNEIEHQIVERARACSARAASPKGERASAQDVAPGLDVERLARAFRRSALSVAFDSDAIDQVAADLAAAYRDVTREPAPAVEAER